MSETNQIEARRILKIAKGRKYVLLAASYLQEKRKGLALAREILEGAAAKGIPPESTVLLVGNLPALPEFSGWKTLSLGMVNPGQMALVYRAADLLLFTSQEDNLPFVIMESLQCGLPPMATCVGGVPDLVSPQEFPELIFDPDQPEEAKANLSQLLNSGRLGPLQTKVSEIGKTLPSLKRQANAHANLYSDRLQKIRGNKIVNEKDTIEEGGALSFPWAHWWVRLRKSKR